VFVAVCYRIEVEPTSAMFEVGKTVQLRATVKDVSGWTLTPQPPVTWVSDDPGVATVSPTGLVTGVSAGLAPIRATIPGAVEGKLTVAVVNLKLIVTPTSANIAVGATTQLTASVHGLSGAISPQPPITWSSDNPSGRDSER
jgi:uncharacterized protein YjdB